MTGESVQRRRDTILAAAGNALDAARARRVRRARIVTAAVVVAIAALATRSRLGRDEPMLDTRTVATHFAVDFAVVHKVSLAIDFATVGSTTAPLLDALTDDEVEAALEESGYCVRLLRMRDRTRLVDCSTGTLTVIR